MVEVFFAVGIFSIFLVFCSNPGNSVRKQNHQHKFMSRSRSSPLTQEKGWYHSASLGQPCSGTQLPKREKKGAQLVKYGWLLDRWFGSIMIMTKQEKLSSAQHQGCAHYFPYEENRSCLMLTPGRKNRVSCPSPFSAISAFVQSWSSRPAQSFQGSILIIDIATYRLNRPRGQCSEN